MPFTKEDKIVIKVLRQEKGYGAKKFVKEFPDRNWSLSSLNKLLKKIDQTGTVDRKPGSGKTHKTRTAQNVDAVDELVLSQENAPGTHRTVRQIAREIGISRTSVHQVIKHDLKLVEEWQMFDQKIIDWAIKQWRPRLRTCVREQGGHFEHQL